MAVSSVMMRNERRRMERREAAKACFIRDIDARGDELSIEEVAEISGFAVTSIREKCYLRMIPYYKRGRFIIFYKNEILKWLDRITIAAR